MKIKKISFFILFLGVNFEIINALNIANIRNCQSKNEYLKPGYISSYSYNWSVVGGAVGSTPQTIGFSADCNFTVKSFRKCYHSLQVLDCGISELRPIKAVYNGQPSLSSSNEPLDSNEFSSLIKRHEILFSLENGNVDNVIAHVDEPLAILNIKRGIISALATVIKPTGSHQTKMRTDVQGTCPVTFINESINTIRMKKDMNGCHFPGKLDWNYSPFSLFWNMSFIQTFYINSTGQCSFSFKDGTLSATTCRERHAIGLDSTANTAISVQTNVTQNTLLISTTKHGDTALPSTANYLLKKIQYEYERSPTPQTPPSNFTTQVKDALILLVTEFESEAKPEVVDYFIRLVSLLRTSSELNNIVDELIDCKLDGLTCTATVQKKLLHYFADALVQCNTVPCLRAFRDLIEKADSSITDFYLNFVLYSWTNIQINDPDFFQEILGICTGGKSRFCPLALSSTIHTFWMNNKDVYIKKDLPTGITNSLDFIFGLIGDKCEQEEYEVLIGLKALGNIGGMSQKYNPEVPKVIFNCVSNEKTSWIIKLAAIQATRRFDKTTYLYGRLLDVLQNSNYDLEIRIESYKILINIWADSPEMVSDLIRFLHSDAAEFQLKSYVLSHLKTIIIRRIPSTFKFAEIIRRAIEVDPKLSALIATQNTANDQKSFHTEHLFYHETPILRNVLNRFGLQYGMDRFYNDQSFLPFTTNYNFTTQLFGKEIDLLNIFSSTRGSEDLLMSLGDLFSKRKSPIEWTEILTTFFQIIQRPSELQKLSRNNQTQFGYSYKIEKNLRDNLERIRREFVKKLDPSKRATLSYAIRMFGDELFFTTDSFLRKTFERLSSSVPQIMSNGVNHQTSGVTQIMEAFNLIPMITGTPLNWTSHSFLVHSGQISIGITKPNGKTTVSMPLEFNGAAVHLNNMIVDLYGFSFGGIQSYSTASTSIDTKIALVIGGPNEIKLELEPPKRPLRILRLTRRNYIFSGLEKTELPDYDVDRFNASWCLNQMVPITGVRLCHSRSYPNVTHRVDKPWCLMAGSSHWELTADFPDSDLRTYELGVQSKTLKLGNSSTIIKLSGIGGQIQRQITYSHIANWTSTEYESRLEVPMIQLELNVFRRRTNKIGIGFTTKATVSLSSHETHSMEYTDSKYSVGIEKSIHVDQNYFNVTVRSPKFASYSWNRTRSLNKKSETIDHHFAYLGIQPLNPNNRLLGDILWENSNSAWVHLQRRHPLDNQSRRRFLFNGYYHLKTPNSIIEIETLDSRQRFYWNLTKTMLPSHELKTFLNMSYISKLPEIVDGVHVTSERINLMTPSQSVTVLGVNRWNQIDSNVTVIFTLNQNKVEMPQFDVSEPEVATRLRAHSHAAEFNSHLRNEMIESIGNIANPNPVKSMRKKFRGHWSLTLPGQKPWTLDGTYYEEPFKKYQFDLLFENPMSRIHLETKNLFRRDQRQDQAARLWFNHSLAAALMPFNDKSKAIVTLDGSLIDGKVIVTERIDSPVFKSGLDFLWNLLAPSFSDIRLNLSTHSPIWNLLEFNLKHIIFVGGDNVTIKHDLMDIDIKGDWKTGFQRTFTFNSKKTDIIPNMIWKIDISNPIEGAFVQLHFVDAPQLDIHVLARLSGDFKQIKFTFCRLEKCRDIESDPNNFISEWTYTLDDPTHLVETIIYNRIVLAELKTIWIPQITKISDLILKAISDADHPLNRMLKPLLKVPLSQWYSTKVNMVQIGLFKVGHHVLVSILDFGSIYNPCIQMVTRAYKYISTETYKTYSEPIFTPNFVPWFWSYFQLKSVFATWTLESVEELWKRTKIMPGPVDDSSYVVTYHLPINLDTFLSRPRLNAQFMRSTKEIFRKLSTSERASDLRDIFVGNNDGSFYNRFALVWGSGPTHLRTFDGLTIDLNENCSHLLVHNIINGKMTVTTSGHEGLIFMFPQMQILLQHDGKIYLNGTEQVTDVPIRSWDGYVNVSRSKNVIVMDTFYHLNVKCIVDENYCLIGTTPWTHGLLVGLLGNNNGDPTDDTKISSRFRLSKQDSCTVDIDNDGQNVCSSRDKNCQSLFNSLSPITMYCHDVIDPKPFADRCQRHLSKHACRLTSEFDFICPGVRAYLALCAAHGLPVDTSQQCSSCDDDHRIGDSWDDIVQSDVDIILVTDQLLKPPFSSTKKGLEILFDKIATTFNDNGFGNVRFGLVTFSSHLSTSCVPAEQNSINGKLLSTIKDFVDYGLRRLHFVTSKQNPVNNSTLTFQALQTACESYSFGSKAVRIFILIVSDDSSEVISSDRLQDILEYLEEESATLYVLSNYPEVEKGTKVFGVRGDGKIFPQPKGKGEQFMDYPKGQFAKLASATRGSLFLRSFLESPADSKGGIHRYINTVAAEMLARTKQDIGLCRSCRCNYNGKGYTPNTKCLQMKCPM